MKYLLLGIWVSFVTCTNYYLSEEFVSDISSAGTMCGEGNNIAMINNANLEEVGRFLRENQVNSVFISGWNDETNTLLRVTVSDQDDGIAVAPHDSEELFRVLCESVEKSRSWELSHKSSSSTNFFWSSLSHMDE